MTARLLHFAVTGFSILAIPGCGPGNGDGAPNPGSNGDARAAEPAFTDKHPKVLFDEAHFNFHTTEGRYKSFVELITGDGFRVTPNRELFQEETLEGFDILVIAGALTAEGRNSRGPAFTIEECDAVDDWVREGGSLLLIADHAPFGTTAETLANRFGVDMSNAHTEDHSNYEKSGHQGWLVFSRENKLLADHPITKGRDDSGAIKRVTTFQGQSLKGPEGSVAFLKLSDTAVDLPMPDLEPVSAAGRSQGLALQFGNGRLIVLGESAVLSDQMGKIEGKEPIRMGLTFPGSDNRQLALNVMHWLSGILD